MMLYTVDKKWPTERFLGPELSPRNNEVAVFTGWKRSLMYFSCGFVRFKGDHKDKREIHNGN